MHLCKHESCWLEIDFIKKKIGDKAEDELRPKKPQEWNSSPHTWLNNFNIEDVMKQYEEKHTDFHFVGVFPMDFASRDTLGRCISEEMCKVNVQQLIKQNIQHIGVILNLDKHSESGSHWVALYCNFNPENKNYGAFYYDSNGIEPTPEVIAFQNSLKAQMDALYPDSKRKFAVRHNRKRHQYGNSECGVFCMHFIERCLKGMPFSRIEKSKVYDKTVHKLRNVYYRPNAPAKGGAKRKVAQ
jgi:hypothetical protein